MTANGAATAPSVGRPEGRGRWFLALLLASGITQAVMHMTRPMLTYRALEIGLDATGIGLMAATFAMAPLIVALRLGRLVDRSETVWFALGGVLVVSVAALSLAWNHSFVVLMVMSAVLGLGHLSIIVAIQALIASGSLMDRYDRRFADLGLAAACGQLVGPAIGGAIAGDGSPAGISAALGTGGLLALLAVPPVIAMHRGHRFAGPPDEVRGEPIPLLAILRSPGMASAMIASLTVGASVDVLTVYLPAYGEEVGWGPSIVGALLAVRAGASIVSRLGLGRLVDRFGRTNLLAASMAISGVTFVALPLAGSIVGALAVMVVLGMALGLCQPLTLAMVASLASRGTQATALSVRIAGNRVGQVSVPIIAGLVAGVTGVAGVLALTGAAIGLSTSVVIGRGRGSTGRWSRFRTSPVEPLGPLDL